MECEGKILIVDDNDDVLLSLNMLLRPWVQSIRVINNPERIIEFMDSFHPDVILLDMNFRRDTASGEEGYEWLARILEHDSASVVIFMTAYVSTEKTVRAIKAGAVDFIPKPWDNKKMLETIHAAVNLRNCKVAEQNIKNDTHNVQTVNVNSYENCGCEREFIGESKVISDIKERIARVAATDANVLITGENGTGKDVVAHELHRLSARKNKPLVSIDLGCIPAQLFESELFGFEKGAFTGANISKMGRIEAADGGTLFLDEIGNLSFEMQQKLLTVIEKREVSRVGSTKVKKIDVRIVAATNSDLYEGVAKGTFREDLLYRLNTVEVNMPSLRERGNDILLLARYFLQHYSRNYNIEVQSFTHAQEEALLAYPWHGNVRELQHSVERWLIDPTMPLVPENKRASQHGFPNDSLNLEELERVAIRKALEQCNGNISSAAELLGITRYALYRKIDKHGI